MDKGHNFLHNHPMTEKRLGLDEQHVIVDRDAWEHAREQGLNLPIPHVSKRSELLIGLLTMLEKEGGNDFIDKAAIVAKYEANL